MAPARSLAHSIRCHSFFWLVAANAVGVILSLVLLWPELGDPLAPFTYGRWMPLHLNWQLYGWSSLPLAGVLLVWFNPYHHTHNALILPARASQMALWGWTLALVAGGISWLQGVSSGKLFIDWHGWARSALPLAMMLLWTVLGAHTWWQRHRLTRMQIARRIVLAFLLAVVPSTLYWASGRDVYPSVNPDSGGATGASLLGSTLGTIAIYGLLPSMLRVPERKFSRTLSQVFWLALLVCIVVCAVINHGHASHHAIAQIAGLSLLASWVPLAWFYFRQFDWSDGAKRWLLAAFVWWLLLVGTGLLTFLPGFSERLKFTHGLVAHAHLAMAGLVSSVNIAILDQLNPSRPIRGCFWLWQIGCAVMVISMLMLGWLEAADAGALFRSESWTQLFFAIRLLSGLAMLVASVRWWLGEFQFSRVQSLTPNPAPQL